MTAEIAIMNKQAIALAADSAVTLGGEGARAKNLPFCEQDLHLIEVSSGRSDDLW